MYLLLLASLLFSPVDVHGSVCFDFSFVFRVWSPLATCWRRQCVRFPQFFPNPEDGGSTDSSRSRGRLQLIKQRMSFFRAEVYCATHGGHLAGATTLEENKALHSLCDAAGNDCWIGLYIQDGAFRWVGGSPVTYTNWHPGEPDNWNGVEECAKLQSQYHDGTWSDQDCEADYAHAFFVCKYPEHAPFTTPVYKTVTSTHAATSQAGGSKTSLPTTPAPFTGAWSPTKLKVDSTKHHFTLNGSCVFLSGINQAWVAYCYDFGNQQYQYRQNVYEKTIQQMKQAGGNSIRIWVHCEGETSPSFDGNGYVNGTDRDNTFISDLRQYIRYAAEHDVMVFITLWNAAVKQSFHYRIDGLVKDTNKLQSYIDKALIPTVQALKNEPGLGGWDIINEFEGQLKVDVVNNEPCFDTTFLKNSGAGWAGHLYTAEEWLRFINYQVDAIRRTDPMAQVTAGAWSPNDASNTLATRNLYSDKCLLKAGGKAMHDDSDYQLDKPLVIAEFNQNRGGGMTSAEQYTFLYNHGYAGAWAWSYTDEQWASMASGMTSIKNMNDQSKGGLVHFDV